MKIMLALFFLSSFSSACAADEYQQVLEGSDSEFTNVTKCFRQYIQTTHKGHLKELRVKNRITDIHRTPNKDFAFVISQKKPGCFNKRNTWFLTVYNLNTNFVDNVIFEHQIISDRITNSRFIFHENLEFNFNFYVLNLAKNTTWSIKNVPGLYTITRDNNFLAYVIKKEHRPTPCIYFHDLIKEKSTFCILPSCKTNGPILPSFDEHNKCTVTFHHNSVDNGDPQYCEITKNEIDNLFTLSDRNAHSYLKDKYKGKK